MIHITHEPIDVAAVTGAVAAPGAGGVVVFVGAVRGSSKGKTVDHLVYQAYEPMAERKLREIADQARERWALEAVAVAHRLGRLTVGQTSVAIAVSAAHRAEAFDACRHLIDRIKQVVPIWKKEVWTDGTSEWGAEGKGWRIKDEG